MRRWIGAASVLMLAAGSFGATRVAAELIRGAPAAVIPADQAVRKASVDGKYDTLLAVIRVPADLGAYTTFNDWGHSATPEWGGFKGLPTGYWVYVYPHWYIWQDQNMEAVAATPQSRGGRSWGPEQVTGEPDTEGSGDIATAWASKTQDGQDEWLALEYARPIVPVAVIVHETFNPGALSRVSLFRPDTEEVDVWKGTDPTPPEKGHGVSIIPISTETAANKIKLYLDSKRVPGWNEIDAVGLIDQMGRTHWAVRAEASSTYAQAEPLPPG
ncbi:MAG: hypothetical protein ACO1SX_04645 [Actinomycetota bacterium]